jgi:hypothetical protein
MKKLNVKSMILVVVLSQAGNVVLYTKRKTYIESVCEEGNT